MWGGSLRAEYLVLLTQERKHTPQPSETVLDWDLLSGGRERFQSLVWFKAGAQIWSSQMRPLSTAPPSCRSALAAVAVTWQDRKQVTPLARGMPKPQRRAFIFSLSASACSEKQHAGRQGDMGWLWFALEMKAAVSVGHTGWLGLTSAPPPFCKFSPDGCFPLTTWLLRRWVIQTQNQGSSQIQSNSCFPGQQNFTL